MNIIKVISIYLLSIGFMTACGGGGNTSNTEQNTVSVTITIDQLPNTVTYNKSVTPDNYLEYAWKVIFDVNGDGAINEGDIELSLLHFKPPGSAETTGPISDFQADLWQYITNTTRSTVAVASKEISGNSITLSVDKSAHSSLASITDTTMVYFATTKRNDISGMEEHDYYPGYSTLVNIPANKQFTDPQGDVAPQEIDMVSMSLIF